MKVVTLDGVKVTPKNVAKDMIIRSVEGREAKHSAGWMVDGVETKKKDIFVTVVSKYPDDQAHFALPVRRRRRSLSTV